GAVGRTHRGGAWAVAGSCPRKRQAAPTAPTSSLRWDGARAAWGLACQSPIASWVGGIPYRASKGHAGPPMMIRSGSWIALSVRSARSEEHTSELQSRFDLVCRLLLAKKYT